EEHLLSRLGAIDVPSEQGAQLIVLVDPLVEDVDQPVDRRLTTDALVQVGIAEGPEARCVVQEATVVEAGTGVRCQLSTKGCGVSAVWEGWGFPSPRGGPPWVPFPGRWSASSAWLASISGGRRTDHVVAGIVMRVRPPRRAGEQASGDRACWYGPDPWRPG